MDDKFILVAAVSGGLLLIVFIGVIIFVCTYHTGIYKSFKKPVKTTGIIEEIVFQEVLLSAAADYEPGDYYIITYSYADETGARHCASFHWQRKLGGAGDKIAVHYDSQNPQNSIADCQLKYGKNLWWKVLIGLAAIIIPAVVIAILFGE